MKRLIYILLTIIMLLDLGCNIDDDYNLVSNENLPAITYSVKLTAPLVNFDSLAYGIVEKQGQMWFVSFDTQGDIMYLNNVSDVFSGDFDLDNISSIEYRKFGDYFTGILKCSNDYHPVRLFYIDPETGSLLDTISPFIAPDTSIISTKCVAVYPNDLNSASVFIFRQFKDTNNVFHQALIRYNCNNSSLSPVDSVLLDTLVNVTVFEQTIFNNGRLYFYLVENFGTDDKIYEFEYSKDGSINIVNLRTHFLPISYVVLDSNNVFTTVHAQHHILYPAIYSLKYHDIISSLTYDIVENYVVTNKIIANNDTTYLIGFIYKRVDELNFADYSTITGDYMMLRFSYDHFLNSPSTTSFVYTVLKEFRNFIPYGILDNGNGFTIIGKGDAFSYFPATIVLKTNYRGKPINSLTNAQH